jgi:hypothetical protein
VIPLHHHCNEDSAKYSAFYWTQKEISRIMGFGQTKIVYQNQLCKLTPESPSGGFALDLLDDTINGSDKTSISWISSLCDFLNRTRNNNRKVFLDETRWTLKNEVCCYDRD